MKWTSWKLLKNFTRVRWQLSIFNRWGNLIFNGFGEAAQWYGNVNEGEYYAEDGSYTFQVQYTDAAGGRKEVKGHIILLR
ncbi:MAG: gliding motility-associated C-terminal domain-containing protein [Bacteroidota bacterium]